MNVTQLFGWEPRVTSLRKRVADTQVDLQRLQSRRDDVLLEKELGNEAAPKQLNKLSREIDATRTKLEDLRKTLALAEAKLSEEQRTIDDRKRDNWLKDIENTVEIRMQLAKKADKKFDEFMAVLAELAITGDKLSKVGDSEMKRLLQLPAFRSRLQAAFGIQLSDFFTLQLNQAHKDAMKPLADLEERERRVYMERVYGS